MKALGKGSIAEWVRIGLFVAWYVLWFSAAMLVLGVLGYGLLIALIQTGAVDPTVLTGGEGNASFGGGDGNFHVTYDNPAGFTWPVAVPFFLIAGVAIGGSLVIVWRLRRLFDSFTSGEPFRRENATHLRVIWITMVVIELSRWVLLGLTGVLLMQYGGPAVDEFRIELEGERITTWMSILILIVLAEVFREGARMKEEQELTI
jgi:hypothetical protein